MNEYLPYYMFGVFFLSALIMAWIKMLINRNMVWGKVSNKIEGLCIKKAKLEILWGHFDLERKMKITINEVPLDKEEKANQSYALVQKKLNNLYKNRKIKKILRKVFAPFYLSLPSRKPENLKKWFKELQDLEEKVYKAFLDIKDLSESSELLTKQNDKQSRESFERKLHERDVKKRQGNLSELMSNLSMMIDYVVQRQQRKSAEVGELGIDQGLEILDFERAKENWEEEIRKIGEMQGEDLLDTAIMKCEDLLSIFKTEGDKSESSLTPVEYSASRIKEKIDIFNFQVSVLTKMKDALNVKQKQPNGVVKTRKLLFKDAPESWNRLDLDGLEKNLKDAGLFLEVLIEDNQFLQHWTNSILSLRNRIEWLEGMKNKARDLHSIKINNPKGWSITKKKLEVDMLEYWQKLNKEGLDGLSGEIKQAIDNYQQRLATRILERVEEIEALELKPGISKVNTKKLMSLYRKVLKGPEKSQDLTLNFGHEPELGSRMKFVHTDRGVIGVSNQGKGHSNQKNKGGPQKSLMNGLLESEERYKKSLRDIEIQS